MWIGDTTCNWDHLVRSLVICCTVSLSGFSFCGSDIPGFFLDPTAELSTRGYQMGCMLPFFRAHADRHTEKREPYLFESPYKEAMIRAVETRYELLPYYYTAFHRHRVTNQAVIRPVFNYDEGCFHKDQILIGDRLMGKAIVTEGCTTTEVYLPDFGNDFWYQRHQADKLSSGETVTINCEITTDSEVPIFVKGGSIVPEFFDVRKQGVKSLWQIKKQPAAAVQLWVYPDAAGKAVGYLYQDDGFTFDYAEGRFNLFKLEFEAADGKATASVKYLHKGFDGQRLEWTLRVVGCSQLVELELDEVTEAKAEFDLM